MKVLWGVALAVTLVGAASHSAAQMAVTTDMTAAEAAVVLAPSSGAATAPAEDGQTPGTACCVVPVNTPVSIELAEPVNVKTVQVGDHFAIRLKDPIVVNGAVVVPAGATGFGVVLQADQPAVTPFLGYREPKLVLDAREIVYNGRHVPLVGLQLAHSWSGLDPSSPRPAGLGLGQFVTGRFGYQAGTVAGSRVADSQPETGTGQTTPEAESANVHLFRPTLLMLPSIRQEYYADGVKLASVPLGQCVTVDGAPGRHLLTERFRGELSSNGDLGLPVAWSSGNNYYYIFRVNIAPGPYGHIGIETSLQEVAQREWDRATTRCRPKLVSNATQKRSAGVK